MSRTTEGKSVSRRKFLKGSAIAVGAATGTLAMPQISRAQTATFKMQGSWGSERRLQ